MGGPEAESGIWEIVGSANESDHCYWFFALSVHSGFALVGARRDGDGWLWRRVSGHLSRSSNRWLSDVCRHQRIQHGDSVGRPFPSS